MPESKSSETERKKIMFDEPLTEGELELLSYKFKTYLGSVSRAIINKRLKEENGKEDTD